MIVLAAQERRGIQSADRAIDVLLALMEAGRPAPLKELAHLADMPSSLAHRYLASLIARGLAVQNAASGLYDLGPLAIRLGAAALSRVDALAIAAQAMPGIAATTGLTTLLNVLGDRGPTIIRWERISVPFVTTLAVGAVLPLTGSASGRTILAFLPPGLRDRLIKEEQDRATTTNTDIEGSDLYKRLAEIRSTGFDTADSSVIPGLSAISAPILDAQGEAVASLTLIGASGDIAPRRATAISQLVQATMAISIQCGGNPSFSLKENDI